MRYKTLFIINADKNNLCNKPAFSSESIQCDICQYLLIAVIRYLNMYGVEFDPNLRSSYLITSGLNSLIHTYDIILQILYDPSQ